MKSPCMQCGKTVAHLFTERPFCSVGCNADYAMRVCPHPDGTRPDEPADRGFVCGICTTSDQPKEKT